MTILYAAAGLLLGCGADLILGDPRWLYHPVRIIGKEISLLEAFLRRIFPESPQGRRAAGFFLVILICASCGGASFLILRAAFAVSPGLALFAECFMCYQLLAVKSLKTESMKVYYPLKEGKLAESRQAVSMIVGRDTENLDEKGVAKAAVETVAENFADGVIAPMFYMALGGPVLMYIYKGINTMDSMVGYKNEKYMDFGRYAAKLDDIANYIPARMAALFLILAAALGGREFNGKKSLQIFRRDRFCHASPNSAQTEAAMAGALGIQLAGDAWYFGRLLSKPFIGDKDREVEAEDIVRANRLMYLAGFLALAVLTLIRTGLFLILI